MRKYIRGSITAIAAWMILFLLSSVYAESTIRIAQISLKNFGKAKASNQAKLNFIAEQIANQAKKGVCAVDELQDKSGKSFTKLQQAVITYAKISICMAISKPVGQGKESYGFFWNPQLVGLKKTANASGNGIQIIFSDNILRDPAIAYFKAKNGFDFILCEIHTRPDSEEAELENELEALPEIYSEIQKRYPKEHDILLAGDFNASAFERENQNITINDFLEGNIPSVDYLIKEHPTNVLQDKMYDNIIFSKQYTTEYIADTDESAHVVVIDDQMISSQYQGEIPKTAKQNKVKWFRGNVMDHCPIYGNFRADQDDD